VIYTYTLDLPYQDPVLNKRSFVKLPRSILLAPYLLSNPYFREYVDAIDEVFDRLIEAKIDALRDIRLMGTSTKRLEQKVENELLIDFTDWGGPERATVVSQVNLLGMKLETAGLISDSGYRTFARFLGSYWFEKGKASCIDFLNFCLKTQFILRNTWTADYKDFWAEGDPIIGATIYDDPPGPWYPTTHVQIIIPPVSTINPFTLTNLFYEIANYNLVLEIIVNFYESNIVSQDSDTDANIVCMAISANNIFMTETPFYPMLHHSTAGGHTGGIGKTLMQFSMKPLNIK
jgi:hypothetical protein